MVTIPQLTECVKPASMPLYVREQILDMVLTAEIERLDSERVKRNASKKDALKADAVPSDPKLPNDPKLPSDPKVREVLENGGFLFVKRDQGGEIWEYQRASRDGMPLTGKEAKRPPVYRLVVWGTMTLRCSCPARPAASAPCKHQDALAWSLGLPARTAVLP